MGHATSLDSRFDVLGELGKGAMGAVYRVREGQREVALKVIQVAGGVTPELRLRFKQEFLAMSKLAHPNTIAVYDYGQLDDHTQYLTMELVEGRELADVLAEGRVTTETGLSFLTQLLQALGFIHARLYVHRDIKAQNIRITPDGTLKLMDFGLMSQLGLPIQAGRISGSPAYMPPEAVRGGVADASSDLYSVGCLAYELFTGRLPFEGRVMDVLRAHVGTPPEPLARLRPDLPEGLTAVVSKLLEKDQRARYQSAGEALADLSMITGIRQVQETLEQQKSYLKSSVLVGRRSELAVLNAALADASHGAGGAALVAAPAGVGKSRLVEEFLLGAKLEGALVLTGRCLDNGGAPYEPVIQALGPILPRLAPALRDRLAPIFPELGGGDFDADEDRLRLQEAIMAALASLRQPVIFHLEDAHWAECQTMALFNHLARAAGRHRLLCLGTLRSDEAAPGSAVWETTDEGTARLIALGPLDATQLTELLRSLFGEVTLTPEMAGTLMDVTGGNPFFLTEVLRYLMETGGLRYAEGAWRFPTFMEALALPESVETTVLRRVASLSAEASALARVAAVVGRTQSLGMLLAASGLPEETFFQDLAELTERQFLVRTETGTAFPHDRVREALYADMAPEERARLHQRCADFLQAEGGTGDEALFDLAHHLGRGQDHSAACQVLKRAADRAYALGAEMLAVRLWNQAAEILETLDFPDKHRVLQDLWFAVGSTAFALAPGEAVAPLEKLVASLEAMPLTPETVVVRVQACRLLSIAHAFSGRPTLGFEFVRRAERLIPEGGGGAAGLLKETLPYASYFISGRIDDLVAASRRAMARFEAAGIDALPASLTLAVVSTVVQPLAVCFQGIRPSDAAIAEALAFAERKGEPEPLLLLIFAAFWPALTGRQEAAEPSMDRVLQLCRRLSMPPHPWVLYLRSYLLWQRGEFEAARAHVEQALTYPQLVAMDYTRQFAIILRGQILFDLGERDAASEAFAAALERGKEQGMLLVTIKALLGLGRVALANGDHAAASRTVEEARAMAASGPARNPLEEALASRLLAQVAIAERDFVTARKLLDRAMAIVTAPEQDNLLQQGLGHQTWGDMHRAQGDQAAAAAAFGQAGECFHRLKNRHLLHGLNQRLDELLNGPQPPAAPAEVAPEARWLQLRALGMM